MKDILIKVVDKDNRVIGSVGSLYYTKHTIKELCTMYSKCGNRLRFY